MRMHSFIRMFVCLSLCVFGNFMQAGLSQAETITIPISLDLTSFVYHDVNSIYVDLSYALTPTPGHLPFIDDTSRVVSPTFTESDIGTLKLFDPSQPTYAKFLSFLTDGKTSQGQTYQEIRWLISILPDDLARGTYVSEPVGALSPPQAVDLLGYHVDSIGFTLRSYTTYPNTPTSGDYHIFTGGGDITFSVTPTQTPTPTPEPATMALMGIGVAGAALLRKRARKDR